VSWSTAKRTDLLALSIRLMSWPSKAPSPVRLILFSFPAIRFIDLRADSLVSSVLSFSAKIL